MKYCGEGGRKWAQKDKIGKFIHIYDLYGYLGNYYLTPKDNTEENRQ